MRIRSIKPDFFQDEELAELAPLTRILFAGLWCAADCEGRLEDRPKKLKVQILPYERCNVDRMLSTLARDEYITRYRANGRAYIQVLNFKKHQRITGKESEHPSEIPPPKAGETTGKHPGNNGETPGKHPGNAGDVPDVQEGKGKEGKGRERKGYSAKADFGLLPSNGTGNCTRLLTHIKDSYKRMNGANLMLSKADENTVKAMIGNYDHAQLMALWDMFAAKNWDWKNRDGRVTKKVPHDIKNFREKISELLEDSSWKESMKKYEPQDDPRIMDLAAKATAKIPRGREGNP